MKGIKHLTSGITERFIHYMILEHSNMEPLGFIESCLSSKHYGLLILGIDGPEILDRSKSISMSKEWSRN